MMNLLLFNAPKKKNFLKKILILMHGMVNGTEGHILMMALPGLHAQ